jgi:hypothetical protein
MRVGNRVCVVDLGIQVLGRQCFMLEVKTPSGITGERLEGRFFIIINRVAQPPRQNAPPNNPDSL